MLFKETVAGIIIFIAKHLKYKVAEALNAGDPGLETCCFMITNVSRKFNLVACYRPLGNRLKVDKWDKFLKKIKINDTFLLLDDFNAHHVEWNCNSSDKNGESLLELYDKHEINILNQH